MQVFKTKLFHKWAALVRVTDLVLKSTVNEIVAGLIDVDLGGSIYKKRIALHNKGKRGGARLILAYRKKKKIFFLYGFVKNERENITHEEMQAFKCFALFLLSLQDFELKKALAVKELIEVKL